MNWVELYPKDKEPSLDEISAYVGTTQWLNINSWLQSTYRTVPKRSYSACSGAPGWNVKYQKSGKSLCTLYPGAEEYIALVVIGNKETAETELILSTLCPQIQEKYNRVPFVCGGKWLMIEIRDDQTLDDVKRLIEIRIKPKF